MTLSRWDAPRCPVHPRLAQILVLGPAMAGILEIKKRDFDTPCEELAGCQHVIDP